MVESMCEELMHNQAAASADLLPATNEDGSPAAICMKDIVGTRRLETPELYRVKVQLFNTSNCIFRGM
jgi:hypothetical protein